MEHMPTNRNASQRRYPPELRERAVRMVAETVAAQGGERHGVVTRVAHQLGIGVESLRYWVKQAEIDAGKRPGTTTEEHRRIAELEKEKPGPRRPPDGRPRHRRVCAGQEDAHHEACSGQEQPADLVKRNFKPPAPNRLWVADLT